MPSLIDLSGGRYGRLSAIKFQKTRGGRTAWLCICDCGNQCVVATGNLRGGHTKSCGCLQRERAAEANTTHGQAHTRIYNIWNAMVSRCHRKNTKAYPEYGGRGITVCDDWRNCFQSFYLWAMANGYNDELSIDRVDNDKGYSPSNCRWVTAYTQANNKRSNRTVEYNGESRTVAEWAKILGIKYATLRKRLEEGWSVEDAFHTPVREVIQ